MTSIVNPLENLGSIPNLGSVSDISAPGITAPGTVSTPSSGAGGITAPTDSSAGVPELPRIESPNGNVSSVVSPISRIDSNPVQNLTILAGDDNGRTCPAEVYRDNGRCPEPPRNADDKSKSDKNSAAEYMGDKGQKNKKPDVVKTYSVTFDCTCTAEDVNKKLAENFDDFTDFKGDVLGGIVNVTIDFPDGPVTRPGQKLDIKATYSDPLIDNFGISNIITDGATESLPVIVTDVDEKKGISFTTTPGHLLYPADITFQATDGPKPGQVTFTISLSGDVDGPVNTVKFNLAGDKLEDQQWCNTVTNVAEYFGKGKKPTKNDHSPANCKPR